MKRKVNNNPIKIECKQLTMIHENKEKCEGYKLGD